MPRGRFLVKDGVSEGEDDVVPVLDGELGGEDGSAGGVADCEDGFEARFGTRDVTRDQMTGEQLMQPVDFSSRDVLLPTSRSAYGDLSQWRTRVDLGPR